MGSSFSSIIPFFISISPHSVVSPFSFLYVVLDTENPDISLDCVPSWDQNVQNHFFRCASDASVPCIGDEKCGTHHGDDPRKPNQTTRRSAVWCSIISMLLLFSRSSVVVAI